MPLNEMAKLTELGLTDYIVFSLVLGISFIIGILSYLKGSNSPNDFLTASRSMHYLPVGFSMLMTILSGITILGFAGEVYATGMQLFLFPVGGVLGIYLTTVVSLPIFSNLELTSMNEYLLLRFQSSSLKNFVSVMFIAKSMVYMGVCLYAPTIALATVTSLDMNTYIYILGVLCTIYSSVGGIRAVIWTDVFQFIVMGFGLIAMVVVCTTDVGGLSEVWRIAEQGNRTELFDMNLDPTVRHTFWNAFAMGMVLCAFSFGIDQLNFQRICSVPNEKAARKLMLVTGVGFFILFIGIFLSGLVSYAIYSGCDPITLGVLKKKEELLPYMIIDRASHIYGLPGLFIATLFSGTLSSLSSALNGVVAMIWKDYMEGLEFFKKASKTVTTMTNRILSLIIGFITIGIAVLCTKSKSLIDFHFITSSVLIGPVYGIFLLGMLVPGCDSTGAWAGLLSSWAFILWISVGATIYGPPPPHLPYSVDMCNSTEEFRTLSSSITNWTSIMTPKEPAEHPEVFSLYKVSYTLYPVLSTIVSVAVGLLVTYIVGKQEVSRVSPKLISPFVRKLYWNEPTELVHVLRQPNDVVKDPKQTECLLNPQV